MASSSVIQLLERESECASLRALIADAARRTGGIAVLDGPPGIGKSALLRWLGELCHAEGVLYLEAPATRLGGQIPFGLARRLLGEQVRQHPELFSEGWARRSRPVFAGDEVGDATVAPIIEGLVALVAELVRTHGPVVLAADDVQWADDSSLAFLIELANRCIEVGAGLACTIGQDAETDSAPALQALRALAGQRLITPRPLSEAAVRELVKHRLPETDDGFAGRLADATAGNPLLVTELLHAAAEGSQDPLQVPDGIADLVLARLDRLGPDAHALAKAVAILGEGWLRLAAPVAGLSDTVAEAAADVLMEHGVLSRGRPLRFAQPILADALLSTIPTYELAAGHRRAAELLAAAGADDLDVAVHLMSSRPNGDSWTCEVLRRAARESLQRGDPSTAVQMLERAGQEPAEEAERGPLLIELARAQAAAGQPSAVEAFERALADATDPSERAEAWHALSRLLYVRGELRLAAATAARGQTELPQDDPRRERLLADELAGAILVPELVGDAAARIEALIGEELPSDPLLLSQLIVHAAWRGIAVSRLPDMARAAVKADPLVDAESGGFPLAFVAGALNFIDQTELSCELLSSGLERVAERGDPLAEVSLRCCRAWARIYEGRLDLARQDLEAVLTLNHLGWTVIDGLCRPPLVVLRLELGDVPGAREALARTPPGHTPGLDWFAGSVEAAAGQHEAALKAFEAAGRELEDVLGVGNPGVLPWRSGAAFAAARLDRREQARELLGPELEQAERLEVPRALGIALRVGGFVERDTTMLKRSVDVLEASTARLELARSLLFLGAAYRQDRRARDAREQLQRAVELAEDSGGRALAQRALAELRAAGGRPRSRPRTGEAALTASERNAARLAASGMTTRQIAAELFLTPKTVEGHLTRVYRKLRISSRSEIAARLSTSDD